MSKHLHFYEIVAGADNSRAMEADTIQKNGASPKSLMSRGNFKNLKKCFILGFAMLLSVASAYAQGGTTGPLTWNINNGTLTISGEGAMPDYEYSGAPWYEYRESIKAVVIENGVTTIGGYAFCWCSALESITLPNSVTTIGEWAFDICGSLKSITLPNGVTTIEDYAFSNCYALTSITLPNSVTTIGAETFMCCYALTSVTLPNNITTIETGTFESCQSLLSITIPNSVTTIGNGAFYQCYSLESITIGSGVTTIGDYAFYYSALETITIPNSVTTIGEGAFYGSDLESITIPNGVTTIGNGAFFYCTALESITVENGNPNYSSTDGILFDKDKTVLTCYPAGKKGNNYVIPNSVTTIGNGAFFYCIALESITLPNGITTIENMAFCQCETLASITIPNSVTMIGSGAFYECTALESITIESGITTIGEWAFQSCTALKSITFPNSVTTIGDYAFEWCTALTSIIIPNSVTTIGDYAFDGCRALESITNLNPVPVAISWSVFFWVDINACTLKVPTSAISAYQATEVWKEFNIEGIDVGIVETDNYPSLRVYPNPTTGALWVVTDHVRNDGRDGAHPVSTMPTPTTTITNIEIFDVMGRTVLVETRHATSLQSEIEMDISHLPHGVYFLRIATDEGVVVRKVVKE